ARIVARTSGLIRCNGAVADRQTAGVEIDPAANSTTVLRTGRVSGNRAVLKDHGTGIDVYAAPLAIGTTRATRTGAGRRVPGNSAVLDDDCENIDIDAASLAILTRADRHVARNGAAIKGVGTGVVVKAAAFSLAAAGRVPRDRRVANAKDANVAVEAA